MNAPTIPVSSPLHVASLTGDLQFKSIRKEWDDLLEHSDQRVFFLRWDWNHLWWHTYAPEGSRLFIIICRDEAGTLVGLAPFYWRQQRVAGIPDVREVLFLGTGIAIKTSEYLDIVSRCGYEQTVAGAVADFLLQSRPWDRLWLWDIPATSKVLPYFQEALGAKAEVKVCDRFHYVDTSTDWAAVKAGCCHGVRVTIDRLLRQLVRRHTCEFRRIERLDDLDRAIDDFVRLHQARWQAQGGNGSFALFRFESFMRKAMHSSFELGRLRFWVLNLDGLCAAALVAFVDRGVAHYFQSGYDPTKSGLGKLMLALCIQDCIKAREIDEFDFMGGGASYKDEWTKTVRKGVELEFLRTTIHSLAYIARRRGRRILADSYHTLLSDGQRKRIRKHLRQFRSHFPFRPLGTPGANSRA